MQNKMFLNIFDYKDDRYPFQIFIGGRGFGKTYSGYTGCLGLQESVVVPKKFLWMRRTQKELELMEDSDKGEGIGDLKTINRDFGTNYGFKAINDSLAGVYAREIGENGKYIYSGTPVGYGIALSTVTSIRGINFSDCSDWVYDEFVPEKHVKKMKGECDALLNAYETINRNREFTGESPIRLWLLANSNDIYNPIFVGLGIVSTAEKMVASNKKHTYIPERGLAIHILPPSQEFREKKAKTALYKLTNGTEFHDMALDNSFSYNDFSLISYRKIQGYIPICALDNAYIYKKKGDFELYVSYSPAKVPVFNSKIAQDIIRFKREYGVTIQPYFVKGRLIFESYELKEKILQIIL